MYSNVPTANKSNKERILSLSRDKNRLEETTEVGNLNPCVHPKHGWNAS